MSEHEYPASTMTPADHFGRAAHWQEMASVRYANAQVYRDLGADEAAIRWQELAENAARVARGYAEQCLSRSCAILAAKGETS